jgi:hypothetical protein
MDPERKVAELFRQVGAAEPDEKFYQWLHGNMFGGKEGKRFDVSRANATATAEKWKGRLSVTELAQMNRYCNRVLVALGYKIWHKTRV